VSAMQTPVRSPESERPPRARRPGIGERLTYAQAPANGVWRFAIMSSFTVLLVIFGVHSIAKARHVR
jgi:hypothetical protein